MVRQWLERRWKVRTACAVAVAMVAMLLVAHPYTRYRGGETDQTAYMLQAQIFARGHLHTPSPPEELRAFFLTRHCVSNGRFFAHYWPLTSALYAVPLSLGVSWYVMHALLYGVAGLFAYLAMRGTRGGVVAAVCAQLGVYALLAERAWTANSMVPAVAFAMLALWGARAALTQWSPTWGAVAGLACGAVFLARPLAGAVLGVSIGTALLVGMLRQRRRWRVVLACGLCVVPALLALLAYDNALTGNPLKPPFHVYAPENRMFFGMRGFQDPIEYFGPREGFINFRTLTGQWWFLMAACGLAVIVFRPNSVASDSIVPVVLSAGLALGLLYCFYFGFSQTMARYLREIAVLLVPFYAWAVGELAAWDLDDKRFPARQMLVGSLVMLFGLAVLLGVMLHGATSYWRTLQFRDTFAQIDAIAGDQPALVVVKAPENQTQSERTWRLGGGPAAYLYNDPWMSGTRLYAVERESAMQVLLDYYRGSRSIFLIHVNEETGAVEDVTPEEWRAPQADDATQ